MWVPSIDEAAPANPSTLVTQQPHVALTCVGRSQATRDGEQVISREGQPARPAQTSASASSEATNPSALQRPRRLTHSESQKSSAG